MVTPLVSVIVPVYNVELYLGKCLDSLINQTYSHLDILLINDGSTDASGKICDEYATRDSRIRVFHKENGGQASARNIGLDHAQGAYVSFVDSDDWLDEDFYASYMSIFISNPKIDIVCFSFRLVYPDRESIVYKIREGETAILEGEQLFREYSENLRFGAAACSHIVRREVVEELSLRYPLSKHEDELFSLRLYMLSSDLMVQYSPEVKYNYLQREGSEMSVYTMQHISDLCLGYRQLLEDSAGMKSKSLPYLNYRVFSLLESFYIRLLAQGVSSRELDVVLKPLVETSKKYEFAHLSEYLMVLLFRYSPKLSRVLGRFYQPIARRLGSKKYR